MDNNQHPIQNFVNIIALVIIFSAIIFYTWAILNSIVVLFKNEGPGRLAVSFSARPDSKNADRERVTANIWNTLQGLRLEEEELLTQWPGVRFDRFAVCPSCHRPSFPGEWLHRTCRGSEEREICPSCSERVLHKCLVPPPARGTGRSGATDQQLSDQQLLCVAKKLGSEWESLAIHMGFTGADVYKFKCDHPYNTKQQIFAMLTKWRRRKGRNATRQELQRVLMEAGVDHDVISCLNWKA